MDKKYQIYSVDDFAQDSDFINWVKRNTNHLGWEVFISENPAQRDNIEQARRVIQSLRTKDIAVSEKEMREVWTNIEQFNFGQHTYRKLWLVFFRYAAVFMLTLTIGATALFFYFSSSKDQFANVETLSPPNSGDAKLILANGEEVLLKEKQTELQFDEAGEQIKIDRDSIVNYKAKSGETQMAQVVIPYGRRSDIKLSDGTKIILNAGSRLIFPHRFTGKYRKVYLEGEAYFDVTKNKEHPFVVSTGNMNITVLGTEFNLKNNASENELEVVLVEGEVSLKERGSFHLPGKEIKLKPNQKAIYNKLEDKTSVESNVNVQYYISWKSGVLKFKRESIVNVFDRLSRYYNVHFVTESSVELNRKISGKLDLKDSLDAVMKVVADAAPITYRIENDTVFVNSKIDSLPMK